MSQPDTEHDVDVLRRALEQVAALLDQVDAEQLGAPSPCEGWTLAELVDHVIASPTGFLTMLRGGEPDWSAPPPHVEHDWATAFRANAEALLEEWRSLLEGGTPPAGPPPAFQTAEFAVHGWDVARTIGWPTDRLDPEVAETALGFMTAVLQPDMRGDAFGPEQPAPPGAGPYEVLAAFAGRTVN